MGRVAVVGAKDAVDEQLGIWARVRGAKLVGRAESLQELHNLLAETKVEVVEFAGEADGAALAAAAQAGAHIFIGSCPRFGEHELLQAARLCQQKGRVLQLPDTLRFCPEYELAREHVRNGAIGKPGVLRLRRGAVASAENADRCLFASLGWREFDWLRWTFGEVERVQANQVVHTDAATGQVLSYALVILKMRAGAIAQVELSWAESAEQSFFELTGDAGMLLHDSRESSPIRWSRGGAGGRADASAAGGWDSRLAGIDPPWKQRDNLIRHLAGEEAVRLNAEDWLRAMDIVQAARESAKTGQTVQLAEGGVAR